ncbi:type IV pilus modification protein PilV [Xenophilus arseniciresistens]|uniref:Type IV pilus modification protein PilV n=1 Tax=Xenophilus arseniciresistens TaxID=1283306 RepID=A0AAE3N4Q8_9BURK|nr:type IV pilus modification protein PilV [Xenophilus arseniciresistens]MDA7415201.1 type IV pilus modification protein PilV [Xenophilus arseniciresistens]
MNPKTHNTQRGATLIEVLVAIVILAVALFGMAGLTSSAVKYNQFSRMRATGLSLVADYAERARANLAGFDDYAYEVAYTATSRSEDFTEALGPCNVNTTNPSSPANTCGSAIAKYDQSQWRTNVANRLPGGTAYITTEKVDPLPGVNGLPITRVLNIWLIWTAIEESAGFFQGQHCPDDAKIDAGTSVNCMYFRVTL